jgi:HTH-type transcriptional regulator/antitoxin HigA
MKMNPKVIRNEADYEASLARIDELVEAELGTPEGDELDLLVTLVELYEKDVYPIDPPDPVEAIRFRMEQMGLKQKDLIPFIGSRSKVSEVLSGQRSRSNKRMCGMETISDRGDGETPLVLKFPRSLAGSEKTGGRIDRCLGKASWPICPSAGSITPACSRG